MPPSQFIDNPQSGGFIKACERHGVSNDSDLVRLRINDRPAAISVASGIILRAYIHVGLSISTML